MKAFRLGKTQLVIIKILSEKNMKPTGVVDYLLTNRLISAKSSAQESIDGLKQFNFIKEQEDLLGLTEAGKNLYDALNDAKIFD